MLKDGVVRIDGCRFFLGREWDKRGPMLPFSFSLHLSFLLLSSTPLSSLTTGTVHLLVVHIRFRPRTGSSAIV